MAGVQEPLRRLALAAALLAAAPARAESRPDESSMFGTAPAESAPSATPAEAAATPDLGMPRMRETSESAPENPLAIGGQLYLRQAATALTTGTAARWTHDTPILADGYFDARPNPRLRAMLRARMSFDPSTPTSGSSYVGPASGPGPTVSLDQAWINFDVARTAFVTAGRQHVKWGSSRFWNPNDLLHASRRDALAQFDARVGETMVKVHVPWEAKGWNFYALELLEGRTAASTVGRIGGAARAEAVLGTGELGIDGLAERGAKPKAGADLSAGVGPIDVYAEGTLQQGTDSPRWREVRTPPPGLTLLESYTPDRLIGAASGGLNWQFKLTDQDAATLGAEYFYNPAGYTNKKIYPWLIFNGSFTPFYVARDYAAAYVFSTIPGTNGNQSLTLSNLANLSDKTAILRLDWTATVVTHMTFEAYAAGHYGAPGGEFRFGVDLPAQTINAIPIPAVRIPSPVAEAGLGLRVNF